MPTRAELSLAQPFAAPETATEKSVAPILCEVLGLDAVGRDDRFFDLGLDSFSALRVSLAAEDRLGLALDTSWMAEEETLRTLCARVKTPA